MWSLVSQVSIIVLTLGYWSGWLYTFLTLMNKISLFDTPWNKFVYLLTVIGISFMWPLFVLIQYVKKYNPEDYKKAQ
jgi:hypothetical protein